jgi:elongation factor G
MQYPLNTGNNFNAIVDLLKMTVYQFGPDGGKPEKLSIPDEELERAHRLHNELVEIAAMNDEKLMNLYFEKGTLDEDELREGLKIGMMKHEVFPVFCISAKKNMGSGRLMGFIDNVVPSAVDMPAEHKTDGSEIPCDKSKPTALFVYKSLIEPHLGNLSIFKVVSGEVSVGQDLINEATGAVERINQLFILDGKNRNPVNKLTAGDIGATVKLKGTHTNDTLHAKGFDAALAPIEFPEPRIKVAIIATNKTDDEKLGDVLKQIHTEDPTITTEFSRESKQMIIGAQGELHLAVLKWRLQHVYKMQVEFEKVKIPYRETISKEAKATYRHKKQSGGAGQFAEVAMHIEPYKEGHVPPKEFTIRGTEIIDLEWGGKLVYYNCIVGGAIDARFMPSILKGIMEKMHEGPITGSYVRDICVYIYDGKMHPVDSNDMAFKIAGMMAFKEAFHAAGPKLLEPVYAAEILVPEAQMGDVMSDLQTRRAIINGMDSKGHYQVIKAIIPLAELDAYSTTLRSLTQGRASYKATFADYQLVPAELQKKLHEEYASRHHHAEMV